MMVFVACGMMTLADFLHPNWAVVEFVSSFAVYAIVTFFFPEQLSSPPSQAWTRDVGRRTFARYSLSPR